LSNETEQPWTAKGLTPAERIDSVYRTTNKIFPGALRPLADAMSAAVRDALAEAAPKWNTRDNKPDSCRDILLCIRPPKAKPYYAIGQVVGGEWRVQYVSINPQCVLGWQELLAAPKEEEN
jgi:hypothetical protein